MEQWKYYLKDDGINPLELYRLIDSGKSFHQSDLGNGFFRAKKDGTWSKLAADIRTVLNASMCGDFDPDESEISEEAAIAYLDVWRNSGDWPGRE